MGVARLQASAGGRKLQGMDVRTGGDNSRLAHVVVLTCTRCAREQEVNFWGDGIGREEVEMLAGMLDGSVCTESPGPESLLGKCGVCSGELEAVVRDGPPQPPVVPLGR